MNKHRKILLSSGAMLFFWSIFDGIVSYLTPIIMELKGFSNTQIGLLISFSALAGAIFDIVISKYVRFNHYLRYFIFLFIVCLIYPILLWTSASFAAFLFLMVLWGIYYDLVNFGVYDLVPRISAPKEHTKNISIVGTFKSFGYLLGPVLIAYVIAVWTLGPTVVPVMYLFLAISLCLFVVLFSVSDTKDFFKQHPAGNHSFRWLIEFKLWRKFSRLLMPVLIFNTLFFVYEAIFWTMGPIFSQQFPDIKYFSILFMSVYIFPSLFVVKFAQKITDKFGKKKTAYYSLILSSVFILPFALDISPFFLLFFVLFSTVFATLAWSALGGAFVDYISESTDNDSQIIGLKDFSANIGYIIGPTLGGILSDNYGIQTTFAILGFISIVVVVLLFPVTPKHINVNV